MMTIIYFILYRADSSWSVFMHLAKYVWITSSVAKLQLLLGWKRASVKWIAATVCYSIWEKVKECFLIWNWRIGAWICLPAPPQKEQLQPWTSQDLQAPDWEETESGQTALFSVSFSVWAFWEGHILTVHEGEGGGNNKALPTWGDQAPAVIYGASDMLCNYCSSVIALHFAWSFMLNHKDSEFVNISCAFLKWNTRSQSLCWFSVSNV